MTKIKTLFYDIETAPLGAYLWGCGKQVVRHNQLIPGMDQPRIICITYCWDDNKRAQCIDWGYNEQDSKRVVEEFDEIIKQADITIGKNNKNFDEKVINAVRMLNGLEPLPNWILSSEDLERQMRRYFRLPSQSLDYISDQLGLGGKIKMQFSDWINIVEKDPKEGEKALAKMIKYGKKDVEDTRTLWNKLSGHFRRQHNVAALEAAKDTDTGRGLYTGACRWCASTKLESAGAAKVSGNTVYQYFKCRDCGRGAGRRNIPIDKNKALR